MAATDQHYRNQKTLDIIFGVSCGAMLFTTLWMFWKDYNREYKGVQRTFRDVETSIAERDMIDKMPDAATVAEKRDELKNARARLKAKQDSLADTKNKLEAKRERADEKARGIKADYDAQMSYYNIAADDVGKVPVESPQYKSLKAVADQKKQDLDKLEAKLIKAQADLSEIDLEIRQQVRAELEPAEKEVADAEESLKRVTALFDRYAKQATRTAWTYGDSFRAMPIVDAFESPTKIKQLWLPDLTIEYGSFKEVPRYDRCTNCHLGIDRAAYDKSMLAKLGDKQESARLTGKLVSAQKMLERRVAAGESLGFDPKDLPGERVPLLGRLTLIVLACVLVAALSLGILERSMRLGIRVLLAGLIVTLLSSAAIAVLSPRTPVVKSIPDMDESKINQFCAHPRLDLFVDSNSPHPMEKFGCTTCHAGQGSATDFINASHTPNGAPEEKRWSKKYGWEVQHGGEFPPNYHWDFPMLQKRFIESSCLKCHHQVTDLIRHGSKEEAPKLLRGYNLIKENGCFGCHEIQGVKSGRWVGPDLRNEPAPPLDWLSPADQDRLKADAANPPGQLRKVGPSLRRLSEKVGEEWTRKWIDNPRGFRDDTRMPHFYNLSTNDAKYLEKEDEANKDNPNYVKQAKFPATEIHAISYYLMHESRQQLAGKDFYREVLLRGKKNISEMHKDLEKGALVDRDLKDLYDISKRFVDLALLSSPTRSNAINSHAARQRQLQDRIQELHRKAATGPADPNAKLELTTAVVELNAVTAALEKLALATPLGDRVSTEDGTLVDLPKEDGDKVKGRQLFTEKGCLACHAHQGTTSRDEANKTIGVTSEANFGPELSRIADKLLAADGKSKTDPSKARRWLVQWIMNPNIHHPRTRMPVTHLSPKDANDIASWLLSQSTGWKGSDPAPEVDADALRRLARVSLLKSPGLTRADVDAFVPTEGKIPGIPADRVAMMPRDMDERELVAPKQGEVSKEKLLWYVGKRAVGRQGCYGCHDIPGFETAKPIGTGLNDWGKKDHDKLAFEDAEAWAKKHFTVVPARTTRSQVESRILALWRMGGAKLSDSKARDDDKSEREKFNDWLASIKNVSQVAGKGEGGELQASAEASLEKSEREELARLKKSLDPETQKRIAELEKLKIEKGLDSKQKKEYEELHPLQLFEATSDGRTPMEETFFKSLEHHHREGFLSLKLMEPRSYDYNRIKTWDDRLRMPQFKFARSRKKVGETDEQHKARLEVEEAEAREAVMTFILGLVAEPVPLKYVNTPKGDRAAEVVGRQVLDKYNCAGCHHIRPGVYEFKAEEVARVLELSHNLGGNRSRLVDDFHYPNTTAWVGPAPAERMLAFGYLDASRSRINDEAEDPLTWQRGTDTIRLTDALRFVGSDRLERNMPAGLEIFLPRDRYTGSSPYGGTFTDLLSPYLLAKDKTKYPTPQGHLPPPLLREGERVQPDWLYKFLLNPGVVRPEGYMLLRMPKFNMSPEESRALVNYFAASAKATNPGQGVTYPYVQVAQREKEFWRHASSEYQTRLEEASKEVERLKKEVGDLEKKAADPKNKDKAADAKRLEELKKSMAFSEQQAKFAKDQLAEKPPKDAKIATDLYSRQAYKLLINRDMCLKCHNIGSLTIEGPQGPNLALAAERLRPEWMEQWIAKPSRLFLYEPVMPQNFPNKPDPLQWVEQKTFVGTPLQQTRAVRDILMDSPRLSDLIATIPPPPPPPPPKNGDKK